MRSPGSRPTLARIVRLWATITLLAPALLVTTSVGSVRADAAVFGTPTATPTYGTGIVFSVPFTPPAAQTVRVELRLQFPQALGPTIFDVAVPAGARQLSHALDLSGGATIVPNTRIVATWVWVPAGGDPVSSLPAAVLYADTTHAWRTLTGSLVRVHWYFGDDAFARHALDIGEKAVTDASALLGVTETDPIDFFIYGDQAGFVEALGPSTTETQVGEARADIRTLFGLITPDSLADPVVEATVPHELVHLVFDTAVHNPYRRPPTWLNEGLAVYLSEGYSADRRSLVERAVRDKTLVPLNALVGRFPADADKGFLAYCEGASAIDYLVRTDGRDALVGLVKAYAGGLTDDEAFTKALGRNVGAFQAGWLKELGAADPAEYGPVAAPTGPVPPGWGTSSGPAASPAPGASGSPGGSPSTGPSSTGAGADKAAILLAIGAVVAVVVGGLVVARRRGAGA